MLTRTDSTFLLIVFLFLFVLAVLWFLLPFAIFGTKDLLEKLIAETIKTRESIDQLTKTIEANKNGGD